jgi:hypothetical protein
MSHFTWTFVPVKTQDSGKVAVLAPAARQDQWGARSADTGGNTV